MQPSDSESSEPDRIRNRQDYLAFLRADLSAHGLTKWSISGWFRHRKLQYQRVLRFVEYLSTVRGPVARIVYYLFRPRLARLSLVSGMSIPLGVFGRGLSSAHYGSIVVNDQARVGAAEDAGSISGGIGMKAPWVFPRRRMERSCHA